MLLRDSDYEFAIKLGVIDEDTKNKCQYIKENSQCDYEDHKYELEIAKLKDTVICLSKELLNKEETIKMLVVYSDRPGLLIGKAGCVIDKYAKAIKSLKIVNIKRVVIEEIYGIVNQFHIDVDKYYNTFMAGYFAYEEAGEEC